MNVLLSVSLLGIAALAVAAALPYVARRVLLRFASAAGTALDPRSSAAENSIPHTESEETPAAGAGGSPRHAAGPREAGEQQAERGQTVPEDTGAAVTESEEFHRRVVVAAELIAVQTALVCLYPWAVSDASVVLGGFWTVIWLTALLAAALLYVRRRR